MSHHHCNHGECHKNHECSACHHEHCSCCAHHHQHECSCCCHHHEHEDFAKELIEMADEAWMEVLKEKIIEEIMSSHSKHLEKLAKLVADANSERWKDKLALQKNSNEFKEKIAQFFNK